MNRRRKQFVLKAILFLILLCLSIFVYMIYLKPTSRILRTLEKVEIEPMSSKVLSLLEVAEIIKENTHKQFGEEINIRFSPEQLKHVRVNIGYQGISNAYWFVLDMVEKSGLLLRPLNENTIVISEQRD